jgi:hypothetical protein
MFAEPLLIPASSAISRMDKWWSSMISVRTLSMISAFQLVDGLPERWSLSADIRPSLKWLNRSLIWVTHIGEPAEFLGLFSLGYFQVPDKSWCNVAAPVFCHLEWNENAMNTCYTTSLSGSDRCIWRCCKTAKNMHWHESPFYHYTQFPHPFAINYRGKK